MGARARRAPREDLAPVVGKAAAALFAERGFEAATMQDIAARVGITAPGLYYYFPSKQVLLHEVLKSALVRLLDALTQAVQAASANGLDPVARLRAFVHAHVKFQVDQLDDTAVYGAA